jgi:hypothetical protein
LVEQMEVGEGSPGSREPEGEGGEGFHIAQTGRRPDLTRILQRGCTAFSKAKRTQSVVCRMFSLCPRRIPGCISKCNKPICKPHLK